MYILLLHFLVHLVEKILLLMVYVYEDDDLIPEHEDFLKAKILIKKKFLK
jgi:hypothetical protein